ncbi:MAG TPA: hypothetical protein VFI30_08020, partial [Nocardioidaceae bacterium]|nr:hypothetical protein [Nocardioidaceae bacterium]
MTRTGDGPTLPPADRAVIETADGDQVPEHPAEEAPRHRTGEAPRHQADEVLGAFAAALRAAGVPVTTDRTREFLRAAAAVGTGDQRAVYWAGRATLCGCLDDLERYDHVFEAWFSGSGLRPVAPRESGRQLPQAPLDDAGG